MLLFTDVAMAQSVAINNDGSLPNGSAILDIKSNNKGLLIPRVNLQNLTDNITIPNPATSLLVFNTNTSLVGGAGFYVWDGNNWVLLLSTANSNFLWSINGNTGTTSSHFIGTTDNARMGFRTNNFQSALLDPVQKNSFWGYKSGFNNTTGTNNTAIGNAALFSNQSLNSITAIGDSALYNNNGGIGRNTAVGVRSGFSTTDGSGNSFVGYESGYSNTIGVNNTGIGWKTLYSNTFSSENTAIGVFSLQANLNGTGNTATGNLTMAAHQNGSYNTAFGNKALLTDTSGADNTALGAFAMYQNKNGIRNTVVGSNAAFFARTGNENTVIGTAGFNNDLSGNKNVVVGAFAMSSLNNNNNTVIGNNAQTETDGLTNATAIGSNADVNRSNALVLGSVAGVNSAINSVNVGIGTTNPLAALHVQDSSVLLAAVGLPPAIKHDVPVSGSGRRMMWYADKAALRAGYAGSNEWDSVNIGNYTIALGRNAMAKGEGSVAVGYGAKTLGTNAVAFGYFTEGEGDRSLALGLQARAVGQFSMAFGGAALARSSVALGNNTTAYEEYATVMGNGTKGMAVESTVMGAETVANWYRATVIGSCNDTALGYRIKDYWSDADPLFVIGNGQSWTSRKNALVVYKSGDSEFGGDIFPKTDNMYQFGSTAKRWTSVWATNGTINTSDARMKKNIQPINYGLQTVMQLKPVSFEWIKGTPQTNLGFIAQDILKVVPEAIVQPENNGTLGLKYSELIPVLTKAIQEQQAEIELLKKKIDLLEKNKEPINF